jgi:hypothetical protein
MLGVWKAIFGESYIFGGMGNNSHEGDTTRFSGFIRENTTPA